MSITKADHWAINQRASQHLPRWKSRYDERWLLLPVVSPARTSVWQAKYDTQRFPNTGFDRIYLTDTMRSLKQADDDIPVNVVRLDV